MDDLKMNVSRSFSRKLNLGNYEVADFFSSRSVELPENTPIGEVAERSEELFALAKLDVENDVRKFQEEQEISVDGVGIKKIAEMVELVIWGKPIILSDFQKCNVGEKELINIAKKAWKRSQDHKKTVEKRDIYTGQADWSKVARPLEEDNVPNPLDEEYNNIMKGN